MRQMNNSELNFVQKMLNSTKLSQKFINKLSSLQVQSMNDCGMGGLVFLSKNKNRKIGLDVASCEFDDTDGVKVIAKLSLDNYGDLFELDIWKTDFSPLINFPEH